MSSIVESRRALLGLTVPVYCELLSGVVAGIIDTAWVARLGEAAVGAVAVASTLENVLLGVILMVNIGTTVLIADALGGGRRGELAVAVRAAASLWLVITPIVAAGGFLLRDEVAGLLVGGDGEVHRLAVAFFAISLPGWRSSTRRTSSTASSKVRATRVRRCGWPSWRTAASWCSTHS
ncbi:MATE family efflux transporter [Paractinoplanes durhamensis]|uniref:MATE family efflux transporter n=1 Tax=Paractinoplanes durhamensis TaxID=113563 RepID=UPI00362FA0EC